MMQALKNLVRMARNVDADKADQCEPNFTPMTEIDPDLLQIVVGGDGGEGSPKGSWKN